MREYFYLMIVFLIFFAFGCMQGKGDRPVNSYHTIHDTVYVTKDNYCDSVLDCLELQEKCIATVQHCDSIAHILLSQRDSLRRKLLVANYKLGRVRYYLNICLKNPTQEKFLKGWVRRAIN